MIRRIAVCDDEPQMIELLTDYLKQFQQESQDEFELFVYNSATALLEQMPRDIHVLLLDIGMEPLSGMEAAHRLREEGLEFSLIFITSMVEYALEGYDVHAFAFLSKPVGYASLKHQLQEIFRKLDREQGAFLMIDTDHGKEIINLNALLYVEVFQHETSFLLNHGRKTSSIPLSVVEKQVERYGFFRCHKSYIVNFRKISRILFSTLLLENGAEIPISKYRRKEFLNAYSRFMGVRTL